MVYTKDLKSFELRFMWVRLPPRAQIKKKLLQDSFFFIYIWSRTRGMGRKGNLMSLPYRKLFKTVGFEGGREADGL